MLQEFIYAFNFAVSVTVPSIYLLMFGYFLRYSGQIDNIFCHQASKLMFNWALPALLFFSILESKVSFSGQIKLISSGAIVATVLFISSEIVAAIWIKEKINRSVFVQGVYRGNTAIIGLAFCANAYGNDGVAIGAIFTGSMTFLYNILAVITLTRSIENQQNNFATMLFNMLKNPLIIAIVAAIFLRIIGITLPKTFSQSGNYLANISLPLALICIGASFDLKSIFLKRDFAFWSSVLRVTVSPALAIILGLLFKLETKEFGVLFLMSATPVAAAAFVMVKAMGGNDRAMANVIALTTVLSMFTASIWISLLRFYQLM